MYFGSFVTVFATSPATNVVIKSIKTPKAINPLDIDIVKL
jgi:hypothetical protein